MNSFEFHGLPQKKPPKSQHSQFHHIKRFLRERLQVPTASRAANDKYITSSYYWCIKEYGRQQWKQTAGAQEDKKPSSSVLRSTGLKYLDTITRHDPDCMQTIANDMIKMLTDSKRIKTHLPEPKPPKKYKCSGPPRKLVKCKYGMRRVRKEWAPEEDTIILDGITKGLNAKEIADTLKIRTPADISAHVKNINAKRLALNKPPLELKLQRNKKQVQSAMEDDDYHSSVSSENLPTSSGDHWYASSEADQEGLSTASSHTTPDDTSSTDT